MSPAPTPVGEIADATPRPWIAEQNGKRGSWIGADGDWAALSCGDTDDKAAANAALIMQAVNSYEAMRSALTDCQSVLADLVADKRAHGVSISVLFARAFEAETKARSALASEPRK